jgi:hypothetical protein
MYMNKKLIITITLFVICVIAAGFLIFNKPKQAEAGWFDDAWMYRRPVAVTNNTTAETNVYIIAIIGTSDTTRFQTDCGVI